MAGGIWGQDEPSAGGIWTNIQPSSNYCSNGTSNCVCFTGFISPFRPSHPAAREAKGPEGPDRVLCGLLSRLKVF